MTTKTTTFRGGDRVRDRHPTALAECTEGIVYEIARDVDDYHVAWSSPTYNAGSSWIDGSDLELVARAHYPPEGSPLDTPMLALTPDVLAGMHLEYPRECRTLVEEGVMCGGCKAQETLRAAIAAAQKEA